MNIMKVSCIIAAGGIGERFNAGHHLPKQFHKLLGDYVLSWSIRAFLKVSYCAEIIVVAPSRWQDNAYNICQDILKDKEDIDWKVTIGGQTRAHSVLNGILKSRDDIEWVAVHDSARPGIMPYQIEQAILLAKKLNGASIVGIRAVDTIKLVDSSSLVIKTIPRDEVCYAQTPQVAQKKDLLRAYKEAEDKLMQMTDEASLLELIGVPVGVVEGGINNMKITTQRDIRLLEAILRDET